MGKIYQPLNSGEATTSMSYLIKGSQHQELVVKLQLAQKLQKEFESGKVGMK